MTAKRRARAVIGFLAVPAALSAQVIDLTIHDVGIAIGDKPRMTGLRINYRDRRLEQIVGVNVTVWSPYQPATGVVKGIALGLPATGARRIEGLAVGAFGIGADESITGIGVAPIGIGAGGQLRGIMVGGIGVGSGSGLTGIGVGLIGVGGGGPMTGLMVGGIGVGGGGDVKGISAAVIGVGSGGSVRGLSIGGVGVGAGGGLRGISIGGIGVGSGGDVTGISIGGIGVGAGGTVRGLTIGGIGVGAPRLEGVVLTGFGAGAQEAHAMVIAPAYFKIEDEGTLRGASVSAYNRVLGTQRGLTLGLLNYARELNGVQVGLINISDNGGRRRIIPIVSVR
jgi:hypothetical protein